MKKFAIAALGMAALCLVVTGEDVPLGGPTRALAVAPAPDTLANSVIHTVCVRCHNDTRRAGSLSFLEFDATEAVANAETAEKMIRKLRAGMMPPPGIRRPAAATMTAMVEELETRLDAAAGGSPNPGTRTFQRLNRAEYRRAMQDLLDLDVDIGAFLPTETISDNFDNIADVQMMSATLMEGYLRAAGEISRMAIGDPDAGPRQVTYKVPKTASQAVRAEGAPLGTRGGISVIHIFPADGEYVFKMDMHPGPTGFLYGMTAPDEKIEVSVNGARVALLDIDPFMSESDPQGMVIETEPIHVRAGPQRVTAAFLLNAEGPDNDLIKPIDYKLADSNIGSAYGVTTLPHLRDFIVTGPFAVTGVSETPSRKRVFSCRPTAPGEERPCAREIITALGTRAYRRPMETDDVEDLMVFFDLGTEDGGFEIGIRTALQAILASPHFVFRLEEVPANAQPGDVYRLGDIDLATRLSYFLWGTHPDDELVELAHAGRLSEPEVLEAQARRLLEDPRSEALATRFASQWFRLQDLEKIHPDALLYPYWDHRLVEAMLRETELFFEHLVRSDAPFFELLSADYTFVNERLARHYGIPGVTGEEFRRVHIPDEARRGLLGHGSILTLTSHADRTSAVLRGKWVMEVLLGSPPPPPPPDVPDLEATDEAEDGRFLTVRERMEMHRSNPACRSCHRVIDPIGLALENFDVTGAWRIKEQGRPVDTTGELYDGTPIRSAADLRAALLEREDSLVRTFVENLMAYALGRRIEFYDMPTVREIARVAKADDFRMTSFIMEVVRSAPFQMSAVEMVADDDIDAGGER
ncbi:DUF1592 domain-containing protein [Candidatus Palauibacter sp.]|uniref:DUF1592 domain-containing protein n=1 Tax=Candidatus Palauibacter sp. TaxID=3101350 RepID=UPI003B5AF37A